MHAAHLPIRIWMLVAASMAVGNAANADDVAVPATEASAPASVTTPTRGTLMNKVESKFGAPAERHAAIGNPPITRWDYPGFSVFFEREHVIHSVVR